MGGTGWNGGGRGGGDGGSHLAFGLGRTTLTDLSWEERGREGGREGEKERKGVVLSL